MRNRLDSILMKKEMKKHICLLLFLIFVNEKLCIKAFNPETVPELFPNISHACNPNLPPLLIDVDVSTGIISSPNLSPFDDENEQIVCSWTLKAPRNYKIWIKFKRLGFDSQCKSKLSFYDGESSNSTLIHSFCESYSKDFETPNNLVHILFMAETTSYRNFAFQFYFKHVKKPRKCDGISTFPCESDRKCFRGNQICNQHFDCNDGKDEEKCFYSKPDIESICGRPDILPKLASLNRIYGGDKAIPGSWPWTVSIRLAIAEPIEGHMCGGILIDYEWVLTAAHCFHLYTPELWTVHLGRYNKIVDHDQQIVRHVDEIFVNRNYTKVTSGKFYVPVNDIALIKLKSAVPLNNPFIKPICLPQRNETHVGKFAYATGWGSTRGTGFELVLKQAMIPIIPKDECQKMAPEMQNVINGRIICAGYKEGGVDTCEGDSGGPLVLFNERSQRWELIGITSTASELSCGAALTPGFYTDVYQFLPFVSETMSKYKLRPN